MFTIEAIEPVLRNKQRPIIKQSVLEEVRNNVECKFELLKHFRYISMRTLERWMSSPKHADNFTQIGAIAIIALYTKKDLEQLLENEN